MKPSDKSYLLLQFRLEMHQKNATGFQSFFEEIMENGCKGFRKIRPYGNQGDGGNDGYIPDKGTYFQVYAPINPKEKEAQAAQKFKDDFTTLKENWDQISEVKVFNFVFNDKYMGVSIELEKARAELAKDNQGITFKVFSSKDLEEIFLTLTSEQLSNLEFDIDSRNALRIARDYLGGLEIELDRGNAGFVLKVLDSIRNIMVGQNDEGLVLDFEIIESKALQKFEKVKDAREKYESIFKRYPKDPRAPLYLAEIYLNNEGFEKNDELLKQAVQINPNYWLLQLEQLIREYRLGNNIDVSKIDEQTFPEAPKIKSDYYRIYSLFMDRFGDQTRAESFIERAVQLNPEKFSGYEIRLSLLQERLQKNNASEIRSGGDNLLSEIEKVRRKFSEWGGLSARNDAVLNLKKLHIFLLQEDYFEFEKTAGIIFELVLQCYFDQGIDKILIELLHYIGLPQDDFSKLLNYLQDTEKPISDELAKGMVSQFIYRNTLSVEGKAFFQKTRKKDFVRFITDLEIKDYDRVLPFILRDVHYAVGFAVVAKSFPELRKKIIEALPNDETIQKEKLSLLLNFEQGDIEEAFSILKNLDLSQLNYVECKTTLELAEKKKAWEFVIILLQKLLHYEKDEKVALRMKVKLFTANLNLERFPEVISIGEAILDNALEMNLLNDWNREILLGQTTFAYLRRGKYPEAKKLIEKHSSFLKTFEAKISVAVVYLRNNDPEKALNFVVEAVKILKRPSPEEYGNLFLISCQLGMPLTSQDEIQFGSFVKLKEEEKWFFIGDEDELDAIKVPEENRVGFLKKKLSEIIILGSKYSSEKKEREIEIILPIDKYILWQSAHNAQRLSKEGLWDKMEAIEVPTTDIGIDTRYLIARLEDQNKKGQEFFEIYCKKNVPLALLALNEGGLTNAIGRIVNERRGFINFSTGAQEEIEEQKKVAEQIISEHQFYIDGTSAFILSETGLLKKIYKFIPNIKVPQSVISLLLDIADKFRYTPGQVGHLRYSMGKIEILPADFSKRDLIQSNFYECIKILESESRNLEVISTANKSNAFFEEKTPPGLSDACILAQRDKVPILTEDFLYLQINELETGKKAPKYCSSFAVVRVLYEQGKLGFDEYLDFFAHLSSYRFRFLPITVEDLEKAVLGDGLIKQIRVEELRKLNFPLTLSEEYGVPAHVSSRVVGHFLIRLLVDDSILPSVIERIFTEVLTTFPTTQDKKVFGTMLLTACVQLINKGRQGFFLGKMIQEKVDSLFQSLQAYNSNKLIIP